MLSLKEFSAKKKPAGAFEFSPEKPHSLDFEKIFEKLDKAQIVLLVRTDSLLVVRFLKKEIHVFKSGKILVEGAKTIAEAKKILEKFFKIIC